MKGDVRHECALRKHLQREKGEGEDGGTGEGRREGLRERKMSDSTPILASLI